MVTSISKFCGIPIEILHGIITYLPLADEMRLSRTCRLLNDLCIPVMYRNISFNSRNAPHALKCFEVITHRESAARSVRNFTLNLTDKPMTSEFRWRVCSDALEKSAPFLTSLCLLSTESLEGFSEVTKLVFPRLRELTMSFPDTLSFTRFVNNHPHLVHLTAFLREPVPRHSREAHSSPLPKLETFMGSAELVPIFARGSRLFRATIMWDMGSDFRTSDYEDIFDALSQSTVPITHLEFNMVGFGLQAFVGIARSLKTLEQLKFRNTYYNRRDARLYDMIYTGIASILPEMKRLVRIDIIDDLGSIDLELSLEQIEMQYRRVSHWSALCDSLELCTMPPRTTWGRFTRSGKWISDLETKVSSTWMTRHCKDIPELWCIQEYSKESGKPFREINLARFLRGDHWRDKRIMLFRPFERLRRTRVPGTTK